MAAKILTILCAALFSLLLTSPAEPLGPSYEFPEEKELESLVAEWEVQFEKDSAAESAQQLALSLQALGIIERQAGKPEEALAHLSRACELLSKYSPALLTDALEAKALTLQDLGQLEAAGEAFREILAQRIHTPSDPKLAATLDHLALNFLYRGRYPEVGPLLDRAEATAPPGDHDFRARVGSHRARLFHTLGSYARAENSASNALELSFKDPGLRLSLRSQLALSQFRLGKTDTARAATETIAKEARELFTEQPFHAVPYLNNHGALALAHGDAEAAANVFLEVLETLSKKSGTDHPSLITPLNNLGVALQTLGNYEAAADILARAADLQSRHFPPTHLSGIETRRNLARNALLSDSPDAKKLIQEVSNHSLMALDLLIREGSEKERLNFLGRFDLISLPCATGNPVIIADVLIASKARLLDAMLSAPEEKTTATWQHIQSTLTPGTAFIDTCRFTTTSVAPEETYGAILILPTGPPQWIPLGSDAELEKWLTAFHNRLAWLSHSLSEKENPGSAPALKLRPILRALYRGFWQPIAEKLPPGTEHIAFSPDSRLHFLPLAALLDSANSPLSSQHLQIATVTSARDLLNAAPQTALSAKPWSVLTLSQFPKSSAPANGDPLLSILSGLQPMPGTKKEAAIISAIAPRDSSFRTGSEATETSLRSASAPAVLHLGCHAFFMPGETSSANLPVDFDENADLLFSGGLVLYNGAKRSPDSPLISSADDLLFPEEIASLPLQGTRLVTLSSCESGAGTPVAGEGLLGLRRAFAIAGAREIAVALWPVADDSTPDFMDRFYRLAIASDRPAQALWQTQAEFLSEAAAEPEAYELAVLRYAPFVLSQNTPLQTGPTIEARKPFPVNPLLLIFGTLPIFLFLSARLFSHKKPT